MLFRLCNAPYIFHMLMNSTFANLINQLTTRYLDDILVYSETKEGHFSHPRKVFERTRES